MDLHTVLLEVESWPAEDRLRLIEHVWDGLAATAEGTHLTQTQRTDLRRRLEAHRGSPKAGAPWEVVKSRLQGDRR